VSEYTPVSPVPREWYYADCPFGCEMPVRASKKELLPKSIKRHITEAHKGQVLPTAPVPKTKKITIWNTYNGSASPMLKDKEALVSGAFPGDSGCIVIRADGSQLVYPRLGVGVKGWERLW